MPLELVYPHIEKIVGEPARLQRMPRVRVAQVVMDYLAHGWSAQEMCRQHPYLKPAEVHCAMGYFFDHQREIEDEIQGELDALRRTEPGEWINRVERIPYRAANRPRGR